MIYGRVALIGLGLIASSMAHAMRRGRLAGEIVGHARAAATRDVAREIGLCDRVVDTAREAAEGADLVVLCVPVGAMGAVAEEIAPALMPGATVSDVGSVKRAVIEAVTPHVPDGVRSGQVLRCPVQEQPAESGEVSGAKRTPRHACRTCHEPPRPYARPACRPSRQRRESLPLPW